MKAKTLKKHWASMLLVSLCATCVLYSLASCADPEKDSKTGTRPGKSPPAGTPATKPKSGGPNALAAIGHMGREMDVTHSCTVIFDDAGSGCERFIPSGWMKGPTPEWIERDVRALRVTYVSDKPHSGATCMRIQWTPRVGMDWVGIYWQHPENNWGEVPGLDLRSATRLVFWAKGKNGGEVAEFKFGGINRGDYHNDSLPNSGSCGPLTTGPIRLSNQWKKYTISLKGKDLSSVLGGFCWVAENYSNPRGSTIFLDDITIDHSRLNEPRLIRSYHPGSGFPVGIEQLRNSCFVYDNALAICAYVASGRREDLRRARLIADALVLLSKCEKDGRLRNAYCCGDLFISVVDRAGKRKLVPRMPGKLNPGGDGLPSPKDVPWLMDAYANGTDCGNVAWAMLAMLNLWQAEGQNVESPYLKTAIRLGRWVLKHSSAKARGRTGFYGGLDWDFKKDVYVASEWQSTEHNIDLAVAFARLAKADPDATQTSKWKESAHKAAQFVRWAARQGQSDGGRLVTGTKTGLAEARFSPKPADPEAWAVLAFPAERNHYSNGLDWVLKNCCIRVKDCFGYGYSTDSRAIWSEGTAQVALALRAVGREKQYAQVVRQLDKIQAIATSQGFPRGSIPAAYPSLVKTGFKKYGKDLNYYKLPHLGATAWYALMKLSYDPFWGVSVGGTK